jgi:hypothetical protein
VAPPGTKNDVTAESRPAEQPEAPVVHARERHVGRADHERELPVREADEAGMIAPNTMISPCIVTS